MPIYEYYCKDCRDKFELLTTYTESEVDIECSKCHVAEAPTSAIAATLATAMISATTMAST